MRNPEILQTLVSLWRHLTLKRRKNFWFLFLVMVLASFAEIVSIGAVVPFLGALTSPESIFEHPMAQSFITLLGLTSPEQLLFPLTIIFIIGAVCSGLMRLFLLWLQTRLSFATGADLGFSIYRRTLYQPYLVHSSRNTSEVISGISNKVNAVIGGTVLPASQIISSTVLLMSILLTFLAIEPLMAISIFAVFVLIYLLVVLGTRKVVSRDSVMINDEMTGVHRALQEGLGGIRDVIIDGTQDYYSNIFRNRDLRLRSSQANVHFISGSPRFIIESLAILAIALLAYFLVSESTSFISYLPVLGAMALGAQKLLPLAQLIFSCWTQIRGAEEITNEIVELLDQPLPDHANLPPAPLMPFQDTITLDSISFKYEKNSPWVLEHAIDLSISKGSRIGFIGATGSGKSTLLDIIMGLLKPTKGNLIIDGIKVTEQNLRSWQGHIAHVPQAIYLADTSITENIAFGIPSDQINHSLVKEAAQKAQIADTIESWSEQYNTMVGERGIRLSGGQRQRIGIARALYKKADVIVFDEATSALDDDTENSVMEAIGSLSEELTVLIIAHRLTTLKNCTQIVELENGQINRTGSYRDIIEKSL